MQSVPFEEEIFEEDFGEKATYEEAFERLELSIAALQDGKIPLNEALLHYQEGMKLAQYCHDLLQQAKLTVQQLCLDDKGTLTVLPLPI